MFHDAGLKDKVAIVTGGARGIGRAIVQALASHGVQVHFFYHQSEQLAQTLLEEAELANWQVQAHQVDIRDQDKCVTVVNNITEQTQRIDILVNNSGIIRDNVLMGLTTEDIEAVFDTNVLGVFNVTRAVTPYMVSQRAGKIINISSISGEKGGRGQTNYAASKGAINAFTIALAAELAARKITVNAVAPGVIETDISKEVRELASDKILNEILLRRFGQPEEVAYAVLFLASRFADYITGEIIRVDGGFKM